MVRLLRPYHLDVASSLLVDCIAIRRGPYHGCRAWQIKNLYVTSRLGHWGLSKVTKCQAGFWLFMPGFAQILKGWRRWQSEECGL